MGGVGFATSSWAQVLGTTSPLSAVLPQLQTTVREASLEGWAAAVGTAFSVQGDRMATTMTLVSAQALAGGGTRPANLRAVPIQLVFEGSQGSLVPAGNRSYLFETSDGTRVQLFVGGKVTVGTKAQLIAVLN